MLDTKKMHIMTVMTLHILGNYRNWGFEQWEGSRSSSSCPKMACPLSGGSQSWRAFGGNLVAWLALRMAPLQSLRMEACQKWRTTSSRSSPMHVTAMMERLACGVFHGIHGRKFQKGTSMLGVRREILRDIPMRSNDTWRTPFQKAFSLNGVMV